MCLETSDDRKSFGLTCRDWLHIQNNNHESLWYCNNYHRENKYGYYPKISPENLAKVTVRLLFRFQHLKYLSLRGLPRITGFVHPNSPPFGSKVEGLFLDRCSVYSDMQLARIISWFPRLTNVTLDSTNITDKGLEALAKCCASLKTVYLPRCLWITDLGISFLLQKCRELHTLSIRSCINITGIGFLGCAHTLADLVAGGCRLTPEGISAIVSGGGLEYLNLRTSEELAEVEERFMNINTEAIVTISNGCPLLKELFLSDCEEVELEGWKAIGQNCKELSELFVMGCQKLCDLGLQAMCDGCNKLSDLYVDREKNNCSNFALELFKRKRPGVMCLYS
ncbi:hypothetical protein MKW94_022479 [Papaver nudicaule]|uniref:At1g61320/AtMIF1 LRR domain-containing protein n=1 Tax=Papaver nudicaule TaxID=74823 RepID=A0AA41V7F2_PAPNU|nr:hypothetical protein [Papaver nudicaule]